MSKGEYDKFILREETDEDGTCLLEFHNGLTMDIEQTGEVTYFLGHTTIAKNRFMELLSEAPKQAPQSKIRWTAIFSIPKDVLCNYRCDPDSQWKLTNENSVEEDSLCRIFELCSWRREDHLRGVRDILRGEFQATLVREFFIDETYLPKHDQ